MLKYLLLFVFAAVFTVSGQDGALQNSSTDTALNEQVSFPDLPGIDFGFNYKGEVFSNVSGGINQKSVYLHNIDLIADIDFDRLFGWKGTTMYIQGFGTAGSDPCEYVGAAQGISSIAAYQTWRLYQFWIEHNMLDDNLSLLFGLYDLNSEFDTRATSAIFINPSHGIGAEYALTGLNGPSIFPNTSVALRVKYNFSPSFYIRTAVLDGVPGDVDHPGGTHILFKKDDGLLAAGEFTYMSKSEDFNSDYFKYSAGAWYYTSSFERLETSTDQVPEFQKGNYGFYLSGEKFLLSEDISGSQGLAAFVRIGTADQSVNQVSAYLGAGLHYTGLIPGRDEDITGIAVASIKNSREFLSHLKREEISAPEYEHIIEFTYSMFAGSWLMIQPDIQYVINPTNSKSNHALVLGARLGIFL